VGPSKLILLSPLQGWSAPLAEAPDAVFAGQMMGDGVAIDPIGGVLHAPCDGILVVVPTSKHAVTLRADNGAEILLHVGIDTVGLGGEGFELHVREGQRVRAGDRLISFDLDLLARRAKSLLTPVIVTDTMGFSISRRSQNCSLQVGDFLMEILQTADISHAGTVDSHDIGPAPDAGAAVAQGGVGGTRTGVTAASDAAVPSVPGHAVERSVLVLLEHGIHARPAASLAAALKGLAADVNVVFGARKANAKSPVGLMALGVRKGDEILVRAAGVDADAAIAALERAIAGGAVVGGSPPHGAGVGTGVGAVNGGASRPNVAGSGAASGGTPRVAGTGEAAPAQGGGARAVAVGPATGTGAASGGAPNVAGTATAGEPAAAGVGLGAGGPTPVGVAPARADAVPLPDKTLKGVVASRGLGVGLAFQFARSTIEVAEAGAGAARENTEFDRAREAVRADLERTVSSGNGAAREIAEAHLGLVDDPDLVEGARRLIESGKSAGYAWRAVLRDGVEALRALSDPRMAERADDLLDLESRVLSALSGHTAAGPELPAESILIANELLPSQLVALDGSKLAGICLAAGGATSHVAIIAAAMDIPTLVATGPAALTVATGTPVVLDAEGGWLYIDPARVHIELARTQLAEKRARRAAEQQAAQRECRTADGARIEVFANVGSEAEAHAAVRNGAEGSGLLRTEFLFLDRVAPPDEAEQLEKYQQIARALDGRPLTIRTLDIGGDKPIPYLPLPHEDNPALGLRGVRTSLWRPDLLRIQLRAILRVRPVGACRILLPMITDPGEIRAVRLMIDDLRKEVGYREPIALGAMIETPASAVMADRIAREVDFLSVGTNDLTQYTLAMDRGHPELAARLDALHPAVLRLIAKTVEAARVHGRTVAVCGGLASDPVAVPVLIGLGVHELSMVPAVIPQLKALISTLSVDECTALATHALERETAEAVRALTLRTVSGLDATGRARE
jgi:multiphosphoryl transfer protein